ncbi:MAG: hypothetical protein ACXABZ_04880 [Candidatus Thorarchaeota archaeon]
MDALGVVVLIVFIATYAIISTEKVNRTGMALLGMGVIGFVFLVAWWMGYSANPSRCRCMGS